MIKVYSSQTLKLSIFCREVLEIVNDDAIEDAIKTRVLIYEYCDLFP